MKIKIIKSMPETNPYACDISDLIGQEFEVLDEYSNGDVKIKTPYEGDCYKTMIIFK